MNPILEHSQRLTRRAFLGQAGLGLGSAALGSLLKKDLQADSADKAGG
ncbi:MAG: twin-arginine translocation signal domain-containing protein, partial [Verrucomicrobia bacterium]|nr:twin-arginine translocation signal domain-containing protein [Verrucomicrobiota bacterium]